MWPKHLVPRQKQKTHFSLKISFSCSVQTFMKCRALYTFIGSSIRPFILINFTRLCSESYIIGGMTDSCLICFSLFCGSRTRKVTRVIPMENCLILFNKTCFCWWKSATCLCDNCKLYCKYLGMCTKWEANANSPRRKQTMSLLFGLLSSKHVTLRLHCNIYNRPSRQYLPPAQKGHLWFQKSHARFLQLLQTGLFLFVQPCGKQCSKCLLKC